MVFRAFAKTAATAMLAVAGLAHAGPVLVATISGQYTGDDPHIYINNSTASAFTNVRLSGTAYNGANALLAAGTDVDKDSNAGGAFHRTQVKNLADIAAGVNFDYVFHDGPAACGPGFSNQGSLFATDYDDTYGCSTAAQPGNVTYTFTALWEGQAIFAVFSPDVNATGHFVGFLGLDETGNAESSYDNGGAASGTGELGVLAEIFVGQPPSVPEPMSLALVGLGLAAAGASRRRRN